MGMESGVKPKRAWTEGRKRRGMLRAVYAKEDFIVELDDMHDMVNEAIDRTSQTRILFVMKGIYAFDM